jgi:hypothetical protein
MFTQEQKIEITRRWDAARSVYPLAVMLYVKMDNLSTNITGLKKRTFSPWLWAPLVIFAIISYLFSIDSGWQWNWASKLLAICIFFYLGWVLETAIEERKFADVLDKIRHIEMIWRSNVVYSDLSEIKQYIEDGYLDTYSEEFKEWQNVQRVHIEEHISQST